MGPLRSHRGEQVGLGIERRTLHWFEPETESGDGVTDGGLKGGGSFENVPIFIWSPGTDDAGCEDTEFYGFPSQGPGEGVKVLQAENASKG